MLVISLANQRFVRALRAQCTYWLVLKAQIRFNRFIHLGKNKSFLLDQNLTWADYFANCVQIMCNYACMRKLCLLCG